MKHPATAQRGAAHPPSLERPSARRPWRTGEMQLPFPLRLNEHLQMTIITAPSRPITSQIEPSALEMVELSLTRRWAGCLPQLPRLRGRTRPPRGQPSGAHLMAAAGIPLRGRPTVSCYPCRGANGPGRGQQHLPGADRVFRCLYYAALRPAEAVALRATSCAFPASGWGQLTLTGSLPRSPRAWTGNGTPRAA
jgi:hypothetical protein